MKPLNPIIDQLLKQKYNSKSLLNEFLRPPPMAGGAARGAAARMAAETGAVEAGVARVGTKGPPIRAVTGGVAKMWPYEPWPTKIPQQTAITSVARTERMNPALVNKDEFEKAIALLKMQVQEVGQGVRAANPEEIKRVIWKEVLNRNPQLKDFESPTLNPALYQLIDDYVSKPVEEPIEEPRKSEIALPTPLTITPPNVEVEPKPIKLTVDTGIQGKKETETETESQAKLDPLAQTIIASALASSVGYKPQPLVQSQLSKVNQKFKTATKTAQTGKPNENVEEEEEFEPEIPRRRREEETDEEFDFDKDPLNQFLERKKSFGEYSGVYGLK